MLTREDGLKGSRLRWGQHPNHMQPEGAVVLHKTCTSCSKCMPVSSFHPHKRAKFGVAAKCKKCSYQLQKAGQNNSPESLNARRAYHRNYYNRPDKIEGMRRYNIQKHKNLRDQALTAYGNKCQCCGETRAEFMAIDHVDPKIKKHRNESGTKLYRLVKKLGYPKEYQCLCHNCNLAKGFYGECPHEKERRECLERF